MSSGATYVRRRRTRPRAIPLALTKISRIDGLPFFLTHGALGARSSAKKTADPDLMACDHPSNSCSHIPRYDPDMYAMSNFLEPLPPPGNQYAVSRFASCTPITFRFLTSLIQWYNKKYKTEKPHYGSKSLSHQLGNV